MTETNTRQWAANTLQWGLPIHQQRQAMEVRCFKWLCCCTCVSQFHNLVWKLQTQLVQSRIFDSLQLLGTRVVMLLLQTWDLSIQSTQCNLVSSTTLMKRRFFIKFFFPGYPPQPGGYGQPGM